MSNLPPAPKSVGELFPSKYLSAEDLNGKSFKLVVASVEFTTIHDRFDGDVVKAVVRFENAKKGLILNKTQAMALAAICGSEEFSAWPGAQVILRPGRAHNGKPTIVVDPVPAQVIP